mmetsp:Transcript_23272/g.25845  ORF Transcript_23272/g.25845 Transcript_23272/m.25845 type:complete len:97 (+) Transcript_23272:127-417(+)
MPKQGANTPQPRRDVDVYKVLIIGDSGVGKSSFISRYVNNSFSTNHDRTIGVEFVLKYPVCIRKHLFSTINELRAMSSAFLFKCGKRVEAENQCLQ